MILDEILFEDISKNYFKYKTQNSTKPLYIILFFRKYWYIKDYDGSKYLTLFLFKKKIQLIIVKL